MNTCTLREQFHFSSVFYKPVLDFFFFFSHCKSCEGVTATFRDTYCWKLQKQNSHTEEKKKKETFQRCFTCGHLKVKFRAISIFIQHLNIHRPHNLWDIFGEDQQPPTLKIREGRSHIKKDIYSPFKIVRH